MITDVDRAYVDFGQPTARGLDVLTAAEAREHLAAGQFPAGSMGPKIEAAIEFVEGGGSRALITQGDRLPDAMNGSAGTTILPE
jgi:carbamate kinase